MGRTYAAIGGANVVNAEDSRAEDVTTPFGIAGTVGILTYETQVDPNTTKVTLQCSATLVGRDLVVTAAHCVDGHDFTFWLQFDPGDQDTWTNPFPVESSWVLQPYAGDSLGIAVLQLEAPVPESIAQHVAPVHLGDVSELLGQPAYVAGFGHSDTCSDCNFRRAYGRVNSPISLVGSHPWLQASLDRTLDAVPWPWPDEGGPLFIFDPVARRYVLAGVAGPGPSMLDNPTTHRWTYLGNPGDGITAHDHRPALLPQLGPDLDGDGVPDASDNCSPVTCIEMELDPVECANPTQADTAGNGLGDACCFVDPRANVRNTNIEAENDLTATARPDACDPVPLVRMDRSRPTFANVAGVDPDVLEFSGQSWIGHGADTGSFQAQHAFRYCGCYDHSGNALPREYCIDEEVCRAGGAVDAGWGFTAVDAWWQVNSWQDQLVPGSTGLQRTFEEGRALATRNYYWRWHDDAVAFDIPSRPRSAGSANRKTQGFFASAVLKNGSFFSTRDDTFDGNLRAHVQYRSMPQESQSPIDLLEPPYLVGNDPCLVDPFGCYGAFLMPWEIWVDELLDMPGELRQPMLVQIDENTGTPFATAWWRAPFRVDFGAVMANTDAWTYPSAEQPWPFVSPVEPMAYLKQQSIDLRGLKVAPADVETDIAHPIYSDSTGHHLGQSGLMASAMLANGASDYVRIPSGGRALFSASRRQLFLIGGSDIIEGELRLRRYDIDTHELGIVGTDPEHAPSEQVLGAAFDYVENVLYVLDVKSNEARLISHDLDEESSRELWNVPYNAAYASTHLGQLEDGQLVLVVSDLSSYTAWSLDVAGETAEFTGRIDGSDQPVMAPVAGAYSLTMPVMDEDGIRYTELAAGSFGEGSACSEL